MLNYYQNKFDNMQAYWRFLEKPSMNINDLTLFVRTADNQSISASARQLDISTAAASAALKRLEKQLGAELFIRSTRQLRITAAGERFLSHCRNALEALEEGKTSLNTLQGQVAGEMRLSVSSDLGRNIILPWLDELMDVHPDLSVALVVGDSLADFYRERVDVALRYGKPEDSSMVAFKIATLKRVLCASPEYLKKTGVPEHPKQLIDHNCLLYRLDNRLYDQWDFTEKEPAAKSSQGNKASFSVKVSGNREANDADLVRRWCVAGKGIAYKSQLDMASDLKKGRVVQVLEGYAPQELDLYLMCVSRQQVTPAVLLLRDLLRDKIKELIID
jgi:DNA-binding transcriptional LysR family regulator